MINFRKGTFETNSSSTHSICICREDENITIPKTIKILLEDYNYEFGWNYVTWNSVEDKLAYLILGIVSRSWYYTSLIEACAKIDKLFNFLKDFGVKEVEIKGIDFILYHDETYLTEYESYVDHASELGELIELVLSNKELLKNFLFSGKSFILGGNDNDERGYQDVKVDYPHIVIHKGN